MALQGRQGVSERRPGLRPRGRPTGRGGRRVAGRSRPRAGPNPARRARCAVLVRCARRAVLGAGCPVSGARSGAERGARREEFSQKGTDGKALAIPIPGGVSQPERKGAEGNGARAGGQQGGKRRERPGGAARGPPRGAACPGRRSEARRGKAQSKERPGRGRGAPHLGDAAAQREPELRALPAPCLGFERRKPGMCGMRAGMRCARPRAGAGGSGGPAPAPRGGDWDSGRGCWRGAGGADGAGSVDPWTPASRSGCRPAHVLPL